MLVIMKPGATDEQVENVLTVIRRLGYKTQAMAGAAQTAINISNNQGIIDSRHFSHLPGVAEAIHAATPCKLVTCALNHDSTTVRIGDREIGNDEPVIIAGPCFIESRNHAMEIAEIVARAGVGFFRGGACKPRTSPYSFEGLGLDDFKILAEVRDRFRLLIITEALDNETASLGEMYADALEVGARNMQNFSLLRRVGRSRKPVILKRGMSATLEEFLLAAEYIMAEGNHNVILCECGIRTFSDHASNTLDLSLPAAVKSLSHLPIIVDPSNSAADRNQMIALARAAIAVGADGVMVDLHDRACSARSNGCQALLPDMFHKLVHQVEAVRKAMDRDYKANSASPS